MVELCKLELFVRNLDVTLQASLSPLTERLLKMGKVKLTFYKTVVVQCSFRL